MAPLTMMDFILYHMQDMNETVQLPRDNQQALIVSFKLDYTFNCTIMILAYRVKLYENTVYEFFLWKQILTEGVIRQHYKNTFFTLFVDGL